MEDELIHFDINSDERPLVQISYICKSCKTQKISYQPYPRELNNIDFRMWCWKCRQIKPHERVFPLDKEL